MSATEWLMMALILGPILCGLLAWLSPGERLRSSIVTVSTLLTALLGMALAWRGSVVTEGSSSLAHLNEVLEFAVILVFLTIAVRKRIWLVLCLSLAQLGMAVFELAKGSSGHQKPSFVVDSLSTVLVLIISIVGSLIVFYGIGYMREHEHHAPKTAASTGRFFFFLTGFLGLMNGLVLTDDIKSLAIFWECTTLCSFFLIGHDRTAEANANARRALVINTLGGFFLATGSFLATRAGGNGSLSNLSHTTALVPIALFILASFTKSAQLPFQSWLLGAMVAPTPVSALLHSSTMVKAGSYLVLRLAPAFIDSPLAQVVAVAGAFTFAITSAIAISQSNAKKILAYSTIANLGLIVACASINNPLAYAAAMMILIYHAISKALLFLCVGTIEQKIGSRQVDDMGGIMFKLPMTTTIAMIGMVSMMAPPFGMLIGKWMAISAAGHTPIVLLLLIIGSALTIFFWGKWMGRIVTTSYHAEYQREKLPLSMTITLIALVVGVFVAGLASVPLYDHWIRPMSLTMLSSNTMQVNSDQLLSTVDDFMGLPLYLVAGALALAGFAAAFGFRNTQVRLPFLCGENVGAGARTYEFRSVADQRVMAQVTSYYFSEWFGEKVVTKWANLIALLILLSFLARIGLL